MHVAVVYLIDFCWVYLLRELTLLIGEQVFSRISWLPLLHHWLLTIRRSPVTFLFVKYLQVLGTTISPKWSRSESKV